MKKILELVGTLLGKDPLEFVNSLKLTENGEFEDEKTVLQEIRKSFSDKFTEVSRTAKDEAYGRAKREVLTEKEKEFKSKFGVDGSNIDEIIDNLIKQKTESTGLTEDVIKNSPYFITRMQELGKKLKDVEEASKAKIKEFEKERFQSKLKSKAIDAIKELGYTLPSDEKKANFLIDVMIDKLNKNGYKEEAENLIVLTENEQVLRDEFQTPVKFQDHVKGVASLLFEVGQPQRQSPNNRNDSVAGATGKWNVKNMEEYMEQLYNISSPDEAKEFKETFKQKIESGEIK